MLQTRPDARGKAPRLGAPARRIVSLVPSTTETLFDLGVGDRVVGVTRFCTHPRERLAGLPRIGGPKDVDIERVLALRPDLVLANMEENTRQDVQALDAHVPVWAPQPATVDAAITDLRDTATLVGADAEPWVRRIQEARHALAPREPWRFAYVIWRNPWMLAGSGTFIAAMLGEGGGVPVTDQPRYPVIEAELLTQADRVWLASEPFPFKERHVEELEALGVERARVRRVDGELLCWHGTRMARGLRYLGELLDEG